jgi:hypothetical protein
LSNITKLKKRKKEKHTDGERLVGFQNKGLRKRQ